jgi:hypothetical protein
MEMWQWVLLFVAVSLNTLVNCWRLSLETKRYSTDDASTLVREAINDLIAVGLKNLEVKK